MAKTILMPTDFTIRSLHLLKHALYKEDHQPLDIVFFTGAVLNDHIIDLMFYSKETVVKNLMTNDFKEACEIIRNKYSAQINDLRFEIFIGFTQAAFNNFVVGNRIDELYVPENKLHYPGRSFDATQYMQKCTIPKVIVSWPETGDARTENQLSELFTSWT